MKTLFESFNTTWLVIVAWSFLMGGITFSSFVQGRYEQKIYEIQNQAIEKGYADLSVRDRKVVFNWK